MTEQIIITEEDILGSIDQQKCFGDKGELGAPGGDATVEPTVKAAKKFKRSFKSRDAHPPGHGSFASTHGVAPFSIVKMSYGDQVAWPDHGIPGTDGFKFLPGLDLPNCEVVISKGMNPEIDSYSAFFENDQTTTTGLDAFLKAKGYKRLFLTGIATNYCVAFTALDGIKLGYEVYILEDCVASIPDGTEAAMRERLLAAGVKFIHSDQLVAA